MINPAYSSYGEYLTLPQFRAVRQAVMDAAGHICQMCGVQAASEVHHRVYPAWGYIDRPENLIAVCHPCHCAIERKAS